MLSCRKSTFGFIGFKGSIGQFPGNTAAAIQPWRPVRGKRDGEAVKGLLCAVVMLGRTVRSKDPRAALEVPAMAPGLHSGQLRCIVSQDVSDCGLADLSSGCVGTKEADYLQGSLSWNLLKSWGRD